MRLFSFFKKDKKDKKTEILEEKKVKNQNNQDDKDSSKHEFIKTEHQNELVNDEVSDNVIQTEIGNFTQSHRVFENIEQAAETIEEKDDKILDHKKDEEIKLKIADRAIEEAVAIENGDTSSVVSNNEIDIDEATGDKHTKSGLYNAKEDKNIGVADNQTKILETQEPPSDCTKNETNETDSVKIQAVEENTIELGADVKDTLEAKESAIAVETESEMKESFFDKLKKTRASLAFGISSLIKGRKIDDDLYEELETALLTADLGVDTTFEIIDRLKEESRLTELHDAARLKKNLHNTLCNILEPCAVPLDVNTEQGPFVILMVGVNGAGKTTTIGKLAQKYKESGKKVMLAAGDTFRAAAVEQLKEWGTRIGVPVVAQQTGSDSASVLFDALSSAKSKGIDVLICDTAGRLQNKDNLMDELKKIVRVMKKIDDNVPQEVMLVLDAATGQNAVSQTKIFSEAVNVTGITLTKLDGTAKGGVIFALADKFKIPIRYVGIGEKARDLKEFKVDPFVEALLKEEK